MTTDDILRMAREADLTLQDDDGGEVSRWREDADLTPYLERFAALVASAEREECAKVCDAISTDKWALYKGHKPYTGQEPGRAADFTQGQSDGADLCEQAIRARGKT